MKHDTHDKTGLGGAARGSASRRAIALAATVTALFLVLAPAASASKTVVDFFGGSESFAGGQFANAPDVAVNDSGAGPANPGDIYTVDYVANRIQRFARDDNGTPADTTDDTYSFVSAWGANVDSNPSGGSDYEICTVAAQCQKALPLGGNGTLAGNGALSSPRSIAIDEDTGNLYVSDTGNRRVSVYSGDGTFLRSFGFDVVASGPDNAGTGYEVCVAANGDVCKAGTIGAGVGQLSAGQGIAVSPADGNPATGSVFVADNGNERVGSYLLDGGSPSSIGSGAVFNGVVKWGMPHSVAVDSRGILYVDNKIGFGSGTNQIERYDTENADGSGVGFLAPILSESDEEQELTYKATGGQYQLSFDPDEGGPQPPQTTADINFNSAGVAVRSALEALPAIGAGNVSISEASFGGFLHRYVRFRGALAATNVSQLVVSSGTTPLAGSIEVASRDGHAGALDSESENNDLAIDPDSDGAGPETDVLYKLGSPSQGIQQLGPANQPGLLAAPTAIDDRHGAGALADSGGSGGLAIEPSSARMYAGGSESGLGAGVFVLDDPRPAPTASLDSLSGPTSHSVVAHATIDPNGPPDTSYHFEYSTDGVNWAALPSVVLGHQASAQSIEATIDPPPLGLAPKTLYHVRLVAARSVGAPIVTADLSATTTASPPIAETTGSPIRTTTTAQLSGRLTPRLTATTYHFEYGSEGPCDANPCTATPEMAAGADDESHLVAEEVSGLEAGTTYHYRLVADNGVGGPVAGADMSVSTRTSEALPGQDDRFPGPPGSDRAWELASMGNSGGNPVGGVLGFSDAGDASIYSIAGGTPISNSGSFFSIYYSKRPPGAHPQSGWQAKLITPARELLAGANWTGVFGNDDLSSLVAANGQNEAGPLWSLRPDGQPQRLFGDEAPQQFPDAAGGRLHYGISADGSRVAAFIEGGGTLDPAYPAAASVENLYDLSSGTPQLLSLLPGETLAGCGTSGPSGAFAGVNGATAHWISDDGSLAYFPSKGNDCSAPSELYLRDIAAGQSKLISGPPLSGPTCAAGLLRGTPGAAFIITASRLAADDVAPEGGCGSGKGRDVYRYDLASEALECVTCGAGAPANVAGDGPSQIAVAEDGSRVYFSSQTRLAFGAPASGNPVYRAMVASRRIDYVASGFSPGANNANLTPDGSKLAFAAPGITPNPLGSGSDNGGTSQFYLYDDSDRSLTCVSCPEDGSAPLSRVKSTLVAPGFGEQLNRVALAADGTFAFATSTPLAGADQNTPAPEVGKEDPYRTGTDVYEWRDGRQLLVSDGLTTWAPEVLPEVEGISPSGRDIFFQATAQYTQDAIDANKRLYDARIDGGIDFPPPPRPCALEVCQGTPKGAPEEQQPASANLVGAGNPKGAGSRKARRCPQGKRKVRRAGKARCVKAKAKATKRAEKQRTANQNRRTAR